MTAALAILAGLALCVVVAGAIPERPEPQYDERRDHTTRRLRR